MYELDQYIVTLDRKQNKWIVSQATKDTPVLLRQYDKAEAKRIAKEMNENTK